MDDDSSTKKPAKGPKTVHFGVSMRDGTLIVNTLFCIVAALSAQSPTGHTTFDYLYTILFCASLIWVSRFVSPNALMMSAALTLIFGLFTLPSAVNAFAAVLTGLYITVLRRLDRSSWAIGAAITTGFIVLCSLSLTNIVTHLSASVMAAATVAPIAISGLSAMPKSYRKRLLFAVLGVLSFVSIAVLGVAVAGVNAKDDVELAIAQAQEAIAVAAEGERENATDLLDLSARNFDSAHEKLSGPLLWPSALVPVLSQHVTAVQTAAEQGQVLTDSAKSALVSADVSRVLNEAGNLDLNLVSSIHAQLKVSVHTIVGSYEKLQNARSPWLIKPLDDQIVKVAAQLEKTIGPLSLAEHATRVTPKLLGSEDQRIYLILFIQPAEAREYGGFVGAYGIMAASQGQLSLVETGSFGRDFAVHEADLDDLARFPISFLGYRPQLYPQNITAVADLPTIAAAIADLAPQWRGDPELEFDGIITIDPYGLASLLELTGPVDIEGLAEPIDADNVVEYLLRGQYVQADDHGERQDALHVLAAATFQKLLSFDLPSPDALRDAFTPIIGANRIAITTFDADENLLFKQFGLNGNLPTLPEQIRNRVDTVGFYTSTRTPSKLDAYTERELFYKVELDPVSGKASGTLEVTLLNDPPPDASEYVTGIKEQTTIGTTDKLLPERHNLIDLITYFQNQPTVAADSPELIVSDIEAVEQAVFGYHRTAIQMQLPDGVSQKVTYKTEATTTPGRYDLLVMAQPTANPVTFRLEVSVPEGWDIDGSGSSVWSTTFDLDKHARLSFHPKKISD